LSFLFRYLGPACAGVLLLAASAGVGLAHGGPPLRVGVTKDPVVSSVARLVLVHLREGVGFAVDWREFPDEVALRAAFSGGRIDIAVGLTNPGRLPSDPASADCPSELLAPLAEDLRKRWGGEVFLLGFPAGSAACARPALIVSRSVLEDLRFGILGKESARMASFITREDVAAVGAAAEGGGERAATAAARSALAAKAKR
jgi:hypothetical protein